MLMLTLVGTSHLAREVSHVLLGEGWRWWRDLVKGRSHEGYCCRVDDATVVNAERDGRWYV